jgi:uncharacterized protein with HEPN domain
MRPRDPGISIEDAVRAGETIREFLTGRTLEEYASDRMLASAVERQFEILGEALSRAGRSDPVLMTAIPGIRTAVGFRNVLAHGYDAVDDATVFAIAANQLPLLVEKLRAFRSVT